MGFATERLMKAPPDRYLYRRGIRVVFSKDYDPRRQLPHFLYQ